MYGVSLRGFGMSRIFYVNVNSDAVACTAGFAGVDAKCPVFASWSLGPFMLGIMAVGIPQVQFSDLVVVPGVQRQGSGPDSAAPCVLTTSGTVGLRAGQFRLKEHVDRTLGGLDDFCFFSGESVAVVSSPRSWC